MIKKIAHHSAHPFGSSLKAQQHIQLWWGFIECQNLKSCCSHWFNLPRGPSGAATNTLHHRHSRDSWILPTPAWGCGTHTWRVLGCCKGWWQGLHLDEERCGEAPGNPSGIPWRKEQGLSSETWYSNAYMAHPNAELANFQSFTRKKKKINYFSV